MQHTQTQVSNGMNNSKSLKSMINALDMKTFIFLLLPLMYSNRISMGERENNNSNCNAQTHNDFKKDMHFVLANCIVQTKR